MRFSDVPASSQILFLFMAAGVIVGTGVCILASQPPPIGFMIFVGSGILGTIVAIDTQRRKKQKEEEMWKEALKEK